VFSIYVKKDRKGDVISIEMNVVLLNILHLNKHRHIIRMNVRYIAFVLKVVILNLRLTFKICYNKRTQVRHSIQCIMLYHILYRN